MTVRKVALIVFYTRDKKILLQDRKGMSKRGAEWGFFGGAIEQGETPEQAVGRGTGEGVYKSDKFINVDTYYLICS